MDNFVTMIRCSPGYCCKDKKTCKGIDSCNTGRTGTLCGTCQANLTESLFSTKCLSFQDCKDYVIIALYMSCVVGYSIMLLVSETIKNKAIEIFKKLFKIWKQRLQCQKHNDSPDDFHRSIDLSEGTDN